MIEKTLKELLTSQDYCYIETQAYPFEGFVTGLKDEMVEMYVFTEKKNLDENFDLELENEAFNDKMIERVVFPTSHIEYIFRDHGLKIKPQDLEAKKMLKDQILNQRKLKKQTKAAQKPKKRKDNSSQTK